MSTDQRKWNGLAVTAFLCSTVGIVVPLVPLIGMALGIFALTRPELQHDFERERTLAILAIAIPPVLVVVGLTLLARVF